MRIMKNKQLLFTPRTVKYNVSNRINYWKHYIDSISLHKNRKHIHFATLRPESFDWQVPTRVSLSLMKITHS